MSAIDLEALKAAARAAVPGPYTLMPRLAQHRIDVLHSDPAPGAPSGVVASVTVRSTWFDQQEATARMFAALHPQAVLALIERLEKAEAELARTERNRDMWRGQSERQAEALRAAREELRRIYEDQAELAKFHLGASAPQPYTGTGAADMARAGYPSAPGHPGSIY